MDAPGTQSPVGLTFFFPAYNDAGTIASLVIQAVQVASRLTSDFEVLVINDGSQDATGSIAEELTRTYPQVRVIHHAGNRGYGGALRTGFAAATKPLVAYTGVICLEMMRKIQDAGFRVVEVPVHHYHRTHGRSQFFNFGRIFWTGIDVLKLWLQLVVLGRGRQSSPVLFRNPTVPGVPADSAKP